MGSWHDMSQTDWHLQIPISSPHIQISMCAHLDLASMMDPQKLPRGDPPEKSITAHIMNV